MKKENKDYLKFMENTIDEIIGKDETIEQQKQLIQSIKNLDLYKKNGYLLAKNKKGKTIIALHNISLMEFIDNTITSMLNFLIKEAEKNNTSKEKVIKTFLDILKISIQDIINK